MVTVRSLEHAPDARFPVMAAPGTGRLVTLEPDDGAVSTLRVREVAVRTQLDGNVREVVHVRRHGSELMLTDARVVVSSTHVEGRSIVAGHVRYPWLVAVGGSRADGRHGLDELRLIVRCTGGDYAVLTLGFDRHVDRSRPRHLDGGADVYGLAADVADRAGRSWLREHPGADSAQRAGWEAMVGARRKIARPGEFALHWMPEYVRVPEVANGALSPAL